MNVRMRAESSTPAMPMTRSRGNFAQLVDRLRTSRRAGSPPATMMQFGEYFTTCSVTACMILKFTFSRSSRLMPGLRGTPDVMTTTSELAVSA